MPRAAARPRAPAAAPSATVNPDTRERLLAAGLALARKAGVKALTVRAVAATAQANLGSFVHHFGTRDAFLDELIERWYAPVFQRLQLTASAGTLPLDALRAALLQLVAWLVDNRDFVVQLVLDAGAGETAALRFLRSLDARHPALLLQMIERAQRAGALRRDPPLHQLLFLMSTLAAPVLMFHLLSRRGVAPPGLALALAPLATDPASVKQRLGWALRGLAPEA